MRGFECKALEIICKEIKTKRNHITCSSLGNRSRSHGSWEQTPSPLPFWVLCQILFEYFSPKYPLIISLDKSIQAVPSCILHHLSAFLFNHNENYPCNFFFCLTHLQTLDLTFLKISYLIYPHLGQCPLILCLSSYNSFFIICGKDNSLCPSSRIIV